MKNDEKIVIYDVWSSFPGAPEEDCHVAVTKNKAKAEALVAAIEACGSIGSVSSRTVSASLPWIEEITD